MGWGAIVPRPGVKFQLCCHLLGTCSRLLPPIAPALILSFLKQGQQCGPLTGGSEGPAGWPWRWWLQYARQAKHPVMLHAHPRCRLVYREVKCYSQRPDLTAISTSWMKSSSSSHSSLQAGTSLNHPLLWEIIMPQDLKVKIGQTFNLLRDPV